MGEDLREPSERHRPGSADSRQDVLPSSTALEAGIHEGGSTRTCLSENCGASHAGRLERDVNKGKIAVEGTSRPRGLGTWNSEMGGSLGRLSKKVVLVPAVFHLKKPAEIKGGRRWVRRIKSLKREFGKEKKGGPACSRAVGLLGGGRRYAEKFKKGLARSPDTLLERSK